MLTLDELNKTVNILNKTLNITQNYGKNELTNINKHGVINTDEIMNNNDQRSLLKSSLGK